MTSNANINSVSKSSDDDIMIKDYRSAIGLFATGVTVLIIEHKGEVRCMTANAVSSLSLEELQPRPSPTKMTRRKKAKRRLLGPIIDEPTVEIDQGLIILQDFDRIYRNIRILNNGTLPVEMGFYY